MATERLWLTQPRRATSIANVTAVAGDRFEMDRSLFAPTSRAHRHPQPQDTGTVWVDGGEKRRLSASVELAGRLWHRLRGAVPPLGAKLQCHLDQDRREQTSRAHTAMHLLIASLQAAGAPAMTADPVVKGGGTFRLEFAKAVAPNLLAGALAQANSWVAANRNVTVEHVVRGMEGRLLDSQRFLPPDPYPGPEGSVTAVRVEGVCCYPCDGTHVARTSQVGRIVVAEARLGHGACVIVGRVVQPNG